MFLLTICSLRLGSARRTLPRSGPCDSISASRCRRRTVTNFGRCISASDSSFDMKRFLFWLVAGVVGLLLLVFVGLGIYTHTGHFHEWARTQILAVLRSTINGEVTFERLSGSFWNGLSFHNLSVRQHETEVIRVPQGSFKFDLLAQVLSYFRSS